MDTNELPQEVAARIAAAEDHQYVGVTAGEVRALLAEIARLERAVWAIKVDAHGHPGAANGRPVPDDRCSVCAAAMAALPSDWLSLPAG